MAFKKREYKQWIKFFDGMLINGSLHDPYLLTDWVEELILDEDYEGAKAAKDCFENWFKQFPLTRPQVETRLKEFYKKIYC